VVEAVEDADEVAELETLLVTVLVTVLDTEEVTVLDTDVVALDVKVDV
jgi:hypothetical protein